ncbi:CTP pyrophosphohydrolase [compost metagenome]
MSSTSIAPVLVVAAVIRRKHDPKKDVLIVRRGPGQSGAGFWEFPGGKVEKGEGQEEALVREIREELGIAIEIRSLVGEEDFTYPAKTIRLRVYEALTSQDELVLVEHDEARWCAPRDIDPLILSEADRPFLGRI